MEREQQADVTLVCAECGAVAGDAALGWRSFLIDGQDGEDEIATFCPGCVEREFEFG